METYPRNKLTNTFLRMCTYSKVGETNIKTLRTFNSMNVLGDESEDYGGIES